MISRVAEHCYWLARYLERAENTARILEVNHTLLLDFHVPYEQQWRPVLIISGIKDFKQEPTAERVQEFMTWDDSCTNIRPHFWRKCCAQGVEDGQHINDFLADRAGDRAQMAIRCENHSNTDASARGVG
mgnify:CR=1 FL=1